MAAAASLLLPLLLPDLIVVPPTNTYQPGGGDSGLVTHSLLRACGSPDSSAAGGSTLWIDGDGSAPAAAAQLPAPVLLHPVLRCNVFICSSSPFRGKKRAGKEPMAAKPVRRAPDLPIHANVNFKWSRDLFLSVIRMQVAGGIILHQIHLTQGGISLLPSDFSDQEEWTEFRRIRKQIKESDICLEETVKKNNEGSLKFLSDFLGNPTIVCQFLDDKLADPKILKANIGNSSLIYYITFEATSTKYNGQRRIYQVKLTRVPNDKTVIFILREKPGQS
ncbi:unnamed protein product [Cuscuta campestris]|uniref:Cystatin domain-containing protein n=1 Tax=Cuscuta campestris TaxID=132261 RepID=A0A484MZ22_9ASTE|nr:unnamed protein product [Cuscuta campestris]